MNLFSVHETFWSSPLNLPSNFGLVATFRPGWGIRNPLMWLKQLRTCCLSCCNSACWPSATYIEEHTCINMQTTFNQINSFILKSHPSSSSWALNNPTDADARYHPGGSERVWNNDGYDDHVLIDSVFTLFMYRIYMRMTFHKLIFKLNPTRYRVIWFFKTNFTEIT